MEVQYRRSDYVMLQIHGMEAGDIFRDDHGEVWIVTDRRDGEGYGGHRTICNLRDGGLSEIHVTAHVTKVGGKFLIDGYDPGEECDGCDRDRGPSDS